MRLQPDKVRANTRLAAIGHLEKAMQRSSSWSLNSARPRHRAYREERRDKAFLSGATTAKLKPRDISRDQQKRPDRLQWTASPRSSRGYNRTRAGPSRQKSSAPMGPRLRDRIECGCRSLQRHRHPHPSGHAVFAAAFSPPQKSRHWRGRRNPSRIMFSPFHQDPKAQATEPG